MILITYGKRKQISRIRAVFLFFITFFMAFNSINSLSQEYSTLTLDNFESHSLRVINPSSHNPSTRYLWSQYENYPKPGAQLGVERLTKSEFFEGSQSLNIEVQKGNIYLHFYPKVISSEYSFLHEVLENKQWNFDHYNRLRFWVKLPSGIQKAPGGKRNTTFGTYFRSPNGSRSSAESGGQHPYHYYNLESTGEWHQIIVDTHPNHLRGITGGREHGNMEYPLKIKNRNYFDSITRFYFDMEGLISSSPANFYFDSFELFRANDSENVDQIYSLHGVHVGETNKILVGWMRNKKENKIKHRVRYSFKDIYSNGWDDAKDAPNGIVKPLGWGGYNGMHYSSTEIDTSGHRYIYIAIKPENSDRFRQIKIPIN